MRGTLGAFMRSCIIRASGSLVKHALMKVKVMKTYCIFEDGTPYHFAEDWQEVLRFLLDRCRGNNQFVLELHNAFHGPFFSAQDLAVWLGGLDGAFDRAIVIHPMQPSPVFMITHLLEPRFRDS